VKFERAPHLLHRRRARVHRGPDHLPHRLLRQRETCSYFHRTAGNVKGNPLPGDLGELGDLHISNFRPTRESAASAEFINVCGGCRGEGRCGVRGLYAKSRSVIRADTPSEEGIGNALFAPYWRRPRISPVRRSAATPPRVHQSDANITFQVLNLFSFLRRIFNEYSFFSNACWASPLTYPRVAHAPGGRYLRQYNRSAPSVPSWSSARRRSWRPTVTIQPIDILGGDAAILFSDILDPVEPMGMKLDDVPGRSSSIPVGPWPTWKLRIPHMEQDVPYVLDTISSTSAELAAGWPLIGFAARRYPRLLHG